MCIRDRLSYLLFLKRLDDEENRRQKIAQLRKQPYLPHIPEDMRWSYWTHLGAADALKHLREEVFPWFRELGNPGSSFELYMKNAELKINKPSLLIEACKLIDQMQISAQNQDVQGDLYEYLLGKLSTSGLNGQFRTPRHIIRMMVQMIDPRPNERIGDLAAGTGGGVLFGRDLLSDLDLPHPRICHQRDPEKPQARNLRGRRPVSPHHWA